jgi:hypothetical protein
MQIKTTFHEVLLILDNSHNDDRRNLRDKTSC